MADNEKRVSRGERLRISADWYNRVNDMVREYKRQRGVTGNDSVDDLIESNLTCLMMNNTGEDIINPFSVLAIGECLNDVVSNPYGVTQRIAFEGLIPSADTDAFAVLQAGIRSTGYTSGSDSGESNTPVARAVFKGLTVVRLLVNDPLHLYAVPVPDQIDYLETAETGSARILAYYPIDESGSPQYYWAIVDLIGSSPPPVSSGGGTTVVSTAVARNNNDSTSPYGGSTYSLNGSNAWVLGSPTYSNVIYVPPVQDNPFLADPAATFLLMDGGSGRKIGFPWQYASVNYPGMISVSAQVIPGVKTFDRRSVHSKGISVATVTSGTDIGAAVIINGGVELGGSTPSIDYLAINAFGTSQFCDKVVAYPRQVDGVGSPIAVTSRRYVSLNAEQGALPFSTLGLIAWGAVVAGDRNASSPHPRAAMTIRPGHSAGVPPTFNFNGVHPGIDGRTIDTMAMVVCSGDYATKVGGFLCDPYGHTGYGMGTFLGGEHTAWSDAYPGSGSSIPIDKIVSADGKIINIWVAGGVINKWERTTTDAGLGGSVTVSDLTGLGGIGTGGSLS